MHAGHVVTFVIIFPGMGIISASIGTREIMSETRQQACPDYVKMAIVKNLRAARKDLKRGFSTSCDMYLDYCLALITSKYPRCKKCNCPLNIPNLSGICDHGDHV